MAQVSILYFAGLREALGVEGEVCHVPDTLRTVDELIDWLSARDRTHAAAFERREKLRCALDQRIAPFDAEIGSAQEIAFFPPVTGG